MSMEESSMQVIFKYMYALCHSCFKLRDNVCLLFLNHTEKNIYMWEQLANNLFIYSLNNPLNDDKKLITRP